MPPNIHLPPAGASSMPRPVLVVTADPSLPAQLRASLSEAHEIQQVTSPAAALERLSATGSPGCVVCDQRVEAAVVEFLDRLRASWPDLPVVLLTDDARMDAVADAVTEGVDGFLPQPAATANPELLAEEVRDALVSSNEMRDIHRTLVEDVLDAAVVGVDIYDADGTLVWCNQELEALFGVEADAYVGRRIDDEIRELVDDLFEEPAAAVAAYERAVEGDTETEAERHVLPGPDRAERWLVHRTRPITAGPYEGGWVSTYTDVTDRRRREQMLSALHRSTRALMRAESRAEVAAGVVAAATDVLGLSSVVVYLWDDHENVLRPAEWSDDVEQQFGVSEPPALDGPAWLGWQAFVEGKTERVDDLHEGDTPFDDGGPFRSGLMVPIGKFGLLVSGAERAGVYTDTDVEFAETLAANATAALERDDFERRLRTQAAALDDKDDELRRLDRTTRLLRGVDRALVDASTRREVEEALCRVVTDVEPYDFAWMDARTQGADGFAPRAWAGDDDSGLLDELRDCLPADGSFPSLQAFETGSAQVVSDLLRASADAPWQRVLLSHGFSSAAAVPLVYGDVVYGVLGVASKQGDPFDDRAVGVLEEVGVNAGNTVVSLARKNALLGVDHSTELEFELDSTSGGGVPLRVAARFDTRVAVMGLVPTTDETYHTFLSVDGAAADAITDYLDDRLSVRSTRVVRESDDSCTVEAAVTDLGVVEAVTDHGATVRAVEASASSNCVLVGVPPATETRAIVDAVRERYPGASLVALRGSTTGEPIQGGVFSEIDDRLTDRQQDVLEAAYEGGYFEWPREQTGEELAAEFGISSPTFHQHLRMALLRLLTTVYDAWAVDDES